MKLAIAGCGATGGAFARAALRNADVELAGTYDPDASKYEGAPGARTYESWDALLGSQADAVLVAAPQPEQAALARTALERGKNVLVPLPLSTDADEASSLFELAGRKGAKLIPCNVDRYCGNIRDVKKHIDGGTIGRIGIAEMRRTVPRTIGWYADVANSGGALYQLLMPELDTLDDWLGGVKNAYGYRRTAGGTDFAVLTVEAESGAIASISVLWGGMEPYGRQYELSGSGGNLRFDSRTANSSVVFGENAPPFNFDPALELAEHNPYGLLLADVAARLDQIDMQAVAERTRRLYDLLKIVETIGEGVRA